VTRSQALLLPTAGGFEVDWGIPVDDTLLDTPYGWI
jgi:hypothetical protein